MNPKDARGATKPPLWLVPVASIVMQAWAAKGGADKYGAYNYRGNEVKASVYISSVMRHLLAYACGEDVDLDPTANGALHLGEALAGLGILADATIHGNLLDDRAKSPKTAAMLRALVEDRDTRTWPEIAAAELNRIEGRTLDPSDPKQLKAIKAALDSYKPFVVSKKRRKKS